MAAITQIEDFTGSSDPLSTGDGWEIFQGQGFLESAGLGIPKSYADDQGMVWSTTFQEDGVNSTTGMIHKVEYSGGFEDGAEWWQIYDYVDANNFRYVKILWGGLSVYTSRRDDVVQLWKRVGGSDIRVFPGTPNREDQLEAGHLRHYQLRNRGATLYPSVTILTARDQHIVRVTMTDRIHANDRLDWQVMKAVDARTTTNAKVGILSKAGSQTITVRSVQAQLVDLKWASPSGSDTNVGSFTSPYATYGKTVIESPANAFGFLRAGTYSQDLKAGPNVNGAIDIPSGTSFEDACTVQPYGNEAVLHRPNGAVANWFVRGEVNFRVIMVPMSGALFVDNAVKLFNQAAGGSGASCKSWRIQDAEITDCIGGGAILVTNPTFSGTPTASDYETSHEFLDLNIHRNSSSGGVSQGTHGIYLETSKNVTEYCYLHDNEGDGGKNFFGTSTGFNGTQITNDNVTRLNRFARNGHYGWLVGSGSNNIMDFNKSWENGTVDGAGLMAFNGSGETYIRNNECWSNGQPATQHGNIAVQHTSLNLPGPIYIDGNTCFDSLQYGVAIFKSSTGTLGPVHWTNNVAHNNADDFFNSIGTTPTTDANNHETGDGDPRFNDQNNGDFSLQSTSPLISAASPQLWTLPWDITGRPRPQGGIYDIGAHEYPGADIDPPSVNSDATYTLTLDTPTAVVNVSVSDPNGDGVIICGTFSTLNFRASVTPIATTTFRTRP